MALGKKKKQTRGVAHHLGPQEEVPSSGTRQMRSKENRNPP